MMSALISAPLILFFLYFIPILGVILIPFYYVFHKRRVKFLANIMLCLGFLLFIPRIGFLVSNLFHFNLASFFPSISEFINTSFYGNLESYAKLLITLGVITYILSLVFKNMTVTGLGFLKRYIQEQEQKSADIAMKNDLKMKEKQERAKNTRVVNCPHCGASNMITNKVGICKYCRREIE